MERKEYVGQYMTQTEINSLIEKQSDIVSKDLSIWKWFSFLISQILNF